MSDSFVSSVKQKALLARMIRLNVKESDLAERFILGSGKGGQKINKTSCCVYIRHLPSGIEVKCQTARLQSLNRHHARVMLCDRVEDHLRGEMSARRQEQEKIRRQKRRRSRRQKAKIVEGKRRRSEKKRARNWDGVSD